MGDGYLSKDSAGLDFGGRFTGFTGLGLLKLRSSGIYWPRGCSLRSLFGVWGALVEERESWAQEQTRKREKMPAEKIHTYSTIQQLVALLLLLLSKPFEHRLDHQSFQMDPGPFWLTLWVPKNLCTVIQKYLILFINSNFQPFKMFELCDFELKF